MVDIERLEKIARLDELARLAKLVRFWILSMTTKAGSGHATSSLSACDLMVALFFAKLRFDPDNPNNPNNDRVIFSKGHASPLLYALWAAAGKISEKELLTYRQFGSVLEGHPTPRFKFVEAAIGSLGQGLSIGLGMALALRAQIGGPVSNPAHDEPGSRQDQSDARTRFVNRDGNLSTSAIPNLPNVYVLMGDSELAEGSVWEAIELASYYKVGNLVGICDVNRLGQSGETMLGWDVDTYKKRVEAFGWQAHVVDGHDTKALIDLLGSLPDESPNPQMIIAKTIKGKGVSFLEDKEGWHGKALSKDDFEKAQKELGKIDKSVRGKIAGPVSNPAHDEPGSRQDQSDARTRFVNRDGSLSQYKIGEQVATRKAFGEALASLGEINPLVVSLDGEVKNSTFAEIFAKKFPERYFEMFIAEQNMVGVALGMSKRGFIPFVSTFAAFLTRAFDQIRMSAYSRPNIKFVGSHAGVSIGEDGPSQMGLEDISMFRSVFGSIVLCPTDAKSCANLVALAAAFDGLVYIRTARGATPVIYREAEEFKIGGSKVVRKSKKDELTLVACGVALHEALKAAAALARKKVNICVIDAYSIKPIDEETIKEAAKKTNNLIVTCEDHYFEGGLGDAVLNVFANEAQVKVYKLAVTRLPMSGKGEELLDYEGISASAIVEKVVKIIG